MRKQKAFCEFIGVANPRDTSKMILKVIERSAVKEFIFLLL